MIRKLVRQMLAAQTLSALTVSVCLLIDNIMIARFLGESAIAAYGLANPVLLVIGAIGSMLSAGVQVACSRSLGQGSQSETNAGYSSAVVMTAAISLAFMAVVLALRTPLARLMGADREAALMADTSGYMAGFIIGAPASMGALILVPFLQMAGRSGLLIASVLGMTVTDVAFDLLNVKVFHGGMFGMGLASSLSYYVAMVIGGGYFLSKKSVFKFTRAGVRRDKMAELLRGGVPTVFNMASSVVLIFAMNKLLLSTPSGAMAVAAFTVIITIGNASNCISTGMGGVSLTLTGILYNEEDQNGLKDLLGMLIRWAVALGVGMAAILIVFAPAFVSLFLPNPTEIQRMAIQGTRLYALGLIPCCVNNAFKSGYQGIGRVRTMELICVMEGAVLPILSAMALIHLSAVWLYFLVGETLTLLGILGYAALHNGCFGGDLLLLPKDFRLPPEDLMEADIRTTHEAVQVSQAADAFCRAHARNPLLADHLALCIEEMGTNIVQHGFSPDGKNHLSMRLQHKGDHWTLRFRDDCRAFDPVNFVPGEDKKDCVGIRLVLHMADEVRYTYSMNLNNLTLVLKDNPV